MKIFYIRDGDLEEELQFDIAMIEDEEAFINKYDFNDGNDRQIFIEENITTADNHNFRDVE